MGLWHGPWFANSPARGSSHELYGLETNAAATPAGAADRADLRPNVAGQSVRCFLNKVKPGWEVPAFTCRLRFACKTIRTGQCSWRRLPPALGEVERKPFPREICQTTEKATPWVDVAFCKYGRFSYAARRSWVALGLMAVSPICVSLASAAFSSLSVCCSRAAASRCPSCRAKASSDP